jgi:hypothetical protein
MAMRTATATRREPAGPSIEAGDPAVLLARTDGSIYGPNAAAALIEVKPTTLSAKVHRMGLKKQVGWRSPGDSLS